MFDPSLFDLSTFAPLEAVVKEYIDDTKSSWSKGKYWLGGQIALNPTDKITDEFIEKVQKINDDSDDYACNMAEMASIWRSKRQFTEIKSIIQKYKDFTKQRVLDELNKTKLNSDVNNIIISMC
jgi:hypothetical protein